MPELKFFDIKQEPFEILVLPVCEEEALHTHRTLRTHIEDAFSLTEFSGKKEETLMRYDPKRLKAKRLLLMGVGKRDKLDAESLRCFAGSAVKACIKMGLTRMTIAVPSASKTGIDESEMLTAFLEGAHLGNHLFDLYKGEKKKKPLEGIALAVTKAVAERHADLPERVSIVCRSTLQAREWVNMPANDKRPEAFADRIDEAAREAGLAVTVMDEKELSEKGFGAMLAVNQGSDAKPRLLILEYRAKGADKTLALVGKGVTFDTGGYNIKVGGSMANMKMDMAGAAAVAATLIAAGRLKPNVNVIGVLPLVENMVSSSAFRPGDIITSYLGKTVEIGNTDAEGRLILIDAMAYAVETFQPDAVIDMATLTGACIVALGEKIAGLFTQEEALRDALLASARRTHERCWTMPLPEDYKELLKSDFADINNMPSSRSGAAITAALFLSDFVEKTPWVHIDIAGPAYTQKETPYCGPGGTGFGVRLISDFIRKRYGD